MKDKAKLELGFRLLSQIKSQASIAQDVMMGSEATIPRAPIKFTPKKLKNPSEEKLISPPKQTFPRNDFESYSDPFKTVSGKKL